MDFTSWSKISLLPPSKFLDFQESEDDSQYGVTYSPSQLHIKSQETDEEDFQEVQEDSFQDRPVRGSERYESFQEAYEEDEENITKEEAISLPLTLVSDLRHMINDYYRRFPNANNPPSNTSKTPQQAVRTPVVQPAAIGQSVQAPKIITIRDS